MILKFIINLGVNQNCVRFVLRAIENKYVWDSLEFHMHQLVVVLLSYSGDMAF